MHLGVIPDGNRRWASERNCTLTHAYAIGFCNVVDLALRISRLGLRDLTFFGLSHDNYSKRPRAELTSVFWQVADSMEVASHLMRDSGICVTFYGDLDELPLDYQAKLATIERTTSHLVAPRLRLNILLNYSVEWDMQDHPGPLRTHALPQCDLIFRSGRTKRLSGFLPVHSANAELYFSSSLWPDVQSRDVLRSLAHFKRASRNFGA